MLFSETKDRIALRPSKSLSAAIFWLKLVGIWHYDNSFNILYKIYWFTIFIAGSVIPISASIGFVRTVWGDLTSVVDSFYFTSEVIGVALKIYTLNHRNLRSTIETLDSNLLINQDCSQDKYIQKSMRTVKKNIFLFLGAISFSACLMGLTPLLTDAFTKRTLPQKGWYYIDSQVSPNYELIYCYQISCKFILL